MGVTSIYIDFLKNMKFFAVAVDELADLARVSRLLGTKLIARKQQDFKALFPVLGR